MPTIREKARTFIQSQGFRKYFVNTGWMMFNQVFNLGVAFFVGVYVARYLGPANYGLLSFGLSVVTFLSVFTALGIREILVRNLVQEPDNYSTILGTALGLRVIAAVVGIIIIFGISPLLSDDSTTRLILIVLSFKTFFSTFEIIGSYFQSLVLAKKVVPVSIAQTIITALVKLYLVSINASLVWFAAVFSLDLLIAAVGFIIVYQRVGGQLLAWKFNLSYARSLLKDSWPLVLAGFVGVIYMQIDQIMIKYMLDEAAVGYYAVAVKFTSIWYFVGGIICSSLMPAVVSAKEKDEKLYYSRIQNLFELMVGIGIAVAVPMSLIAYPLVDFLYGSAFLPAANVMIIHVWSLIFIFLGVAGSKWLLVENLQIYNLNRSILSAIINVGLNFWLIPTYGIQGAAVATLVSHATSSYFGHLLSKNTWVVFRMQSKALMLSSVYRLVKRQL